MTDEKQAAYDRGLQAMQHSQAAPGSLLAGMNNAHNLIKQRAAELVPYDWASSSETLQELVERALREGMAMRVPDEKPIPLQGLRITTAEEGLEVGKAHGWNACRAAMLARNGE